MRISRQKKSPLDWKRIRAELAELLHRDPMPPPVCSDRCTSYSEERCNRHCPDAPAMLSSDPDYPLEEKIAPLVFELKRLGAFNPCWSCEGHNGHDGTLWKIPRVWFYAESVLHVRVLADAVAELYVNDKLNAMWQVTLTASDPTNPDTSFSLQPAIGKEGVPLHLLHRDLETITEHLRGVVLAKARGLEEAANQHDRHTDQNRAPEPSGSGRLFDSLRKGRP